jgi:hypothetical protein
MLILVLGASVLLLWDLISDIAPVVKARNAVGTSDFPELASAGDRDVMIVSVGSPESGPSVPGDEGGEDFSEEVGRKRASRGSIPGEHVLGFYNAYDRSEFIRLAKLKGIQILDSMDFGNAVRVRASDEDFKELLKESPVPLNQDGNHYVYGPPDHGADPLPAESGYVALGDMSLQWLGLKGNNSQWGKGVVVAVLDSGVASHPSLAGTEIKRIDLVGGEVAGEEGGNMHGTAVASLIAGSSEEMQGIAPSSTILSVRVMPEDGMGNSFTLAKGIVEAVDNGAQVINVALGAYSDDFLLRQAVEYAQENNVIIAASSGNDAVEGVMYPARYDGVVCVSGNDGAGRHVFFANRGEEVDLSAPAIGLTAAGEDGGYEPFGGTSASVALASGTLAWLLSEESGLSSDEAVKVMLENSNDSGAPGEDDLFGNGILNISRIQDRNTKGVIDAAVCNPYVVASDDGTTVTLFVENRGTEALKSVVMDVNIDGSAEEVRFFGIDVGEVDGKEFRLDKEKLVGTDGVSISYGVKVDGVEDVFRFNDFRKVTVIQRADGS